MAELSYMELWASDDSIGGKFDVIRDGYQKIYRKRANAEETLEGGLDVQVGGVHAFYNYVVRVAHTDERGAGWGTYATLLALFQLNNPIGTPTNLLKHTDHHGNEEEVYMLGEFMGNLLACRIEGTQAYWDVQVTLRVKPS